MEIARQVKARRAQMFLLVLLSGLAFLIILGQLFHHPSEVRNLITGDFPDGIYLEYPSIYVLFSPFFQISDHLTILSLNQHIAFLLFLNGIWILSRILILYPAALAAKSIV